MSDYEKTLNFWEQNSIKGNVYGSFLISDDNLGNYRLKWEQRYLDKIIKHFFLSKNNLKILDVGCGTGNFVDFFSGYGSVIGFDFSKNSIDYCRSRFKNIKGVSFSVGNILDFDIKEKFDLIFVGGVLMYIEDKDINKAIENLANLLSKDGIIIFREATMSRRTITTYEGKEYVMPCFRRELHEYEKKFQLHNLNVKKIIPNFVCTYTTLISQYRRILNININLFKNKIVELFFLYIPFKIFLLFRKNMYTYHFIIVNKL